MRYTAVFFDAGETLVHPHPTFPDLFAEILRREGHDVAPQAIHDRIHVVSDRFRVAAETNELWTTSLERSRRFWHDVYTIFLRELGVSNGGGLINRIYREFTDLANYTLFDDVRPVLRVLRDAGIRLGVVSNFEDWLEGLLERLGIGSFFDVRVISGVEGLEKPDPRIFRLAMERAGVEPAVSVYVGDNPEFDVDPALALGMFPVLIDRRGRYPDVAVPRIHSLADLPAVIGLAAGGTDA
ncbi:MAG TPA: HAD-IA family hydrolase [Actinomycetota bacterium]|nr:HAD-IA family hydrolase [Actinomycetota bacterium]